MRLRALGPTRQLILLDHQPIAQFVQLLLEIRPKMSFRSEGSVWKAAVQRRSENHGPCPCFLLWAFWGLRVATNATRSHSHLKACGTG